MDQVQRQLSCITSSDSVIFQLCLLIAFASLSGFTLHFKDDLYGGRFDFFYFATITPWLLVIIIYVLFALRLHERLANINWDFVVSTSEIKSFVWSCLYYLFNEKLHAKLVTQITFEQGKKQ